MRDPVVRVGRLVAAVDQGIGACGDRRRAAVGYVLFDGKHILVVHRDFLREDLALTIIPAQRDRRRRRQGRAIGRPDRLRPRDRDAVRNPVEAGVIGSRRPLGRQQADVGRILRDRLAVFGQRQIVDPRAG